MYFSDYLLFNSGVCMKIERPDWAYEGAFPANNDLEYAENCLNEWFDKHVEPINKMLSEGVEVYGFQGPEGYAMEQFHSKETDTHKGILINIEPIKKETAEDVLRDIVRDCDNAGIESMEDYYNRAKKVLGEE